MRIDALHLAAVGPFTDRRLDLAAGTEGVHVLYGPNESGKSSALRALRALLYGFPQQTPDNFLHPYNRLRVGADLRGADGRVVTVFRRKGNRNTLLDARGEVLPEDTLLALLGGVDEKLFDVQFGIDLDALVRGGRSLVEEHGSEAEALFGAGLGSSEVHGVLKGLDEEAQALFVPRGTTRAINALASEIEALRKREREAMLLVTHYESARRDVSGARRALQDVDRERDDALREQARLKRIQATWAPLRRRARALDTLAALGDAPELPAEFAARRKDAWERRRLAGASRVRAEAQLEQLERDMSRVRVDARLLDEAPAIDALLPRLAVHLEAAADRVQIAADHERARATLTELRTRLPQGLREESMPSLRAHLSRRRLAEELAEEQAGCSAALEAARRRHEDSRAARDRLLRELDASPVPPEVPELARSVREARRAGDLDSRIAQLEIAVAEHDRKDTRELGALPRWERGLDALASAPLPEDETIRSFARRMDELGQRLRRMDEAQADAHARRAGAGRALRELELAGQPPAESDLSAARDRRDTGWALLRARWVDGADVQAAASQYAGGDDLPGAFERAMHDADGIADRLRREAQAVHERAAQTAALESAERDLAALAAQRQVAQDGRDALEREWRQAWAGAGVTPASPAEMSAWRQRAQQIRARIDEAEAAREALRQALALRRDLCARLASVPGVTPAGGAAPATLASVLEQCEEHLAQLQETRSKHGERRTSLARLEDECRQRDAELQAATQALARWRERWGALVEELGLPGVATPAELRDHFALVQELADVAEQARRDGERLAGIDRNAQAFEADTRELCRRVAPALAQRAPQDAARRLGQLLEAQRTASTELDGLRRQARKTRRELEQAQAELAQADAELAQLCLVAGGVEVEALEEVEQRDRSRREAGATLAEALGEIERVGEGQSVEALEQAAAQVSPDDLAVRLVALAERIEKEIVPRRDDLIRRKEAAQAALSRMSGDSDAAALAEQREQCRSEMRSLAERYVRLRLAARLLREQIHEFRRQHRDPILASAGGYLRTLTQGRYRAVRTQFDAADEPVLSVVRDTDEALGVDALSTGTRDQLFLALRLATLEHHLRSGEPLPFVVDDILVQFDEGRARATVEALASFSTRTQVLLFTHHAQVARDARDLAGVGGGVFVHEL